MHPAEFPGGDLVAEGVMDLRAGKVTVAAALVSRARTRLAGSGVELPDEPRIDDPGRTMYELLGQQGRDGDTHAAYNALTRRLVSFMDACEARARRRTSGS